MDHVQCHRLQSMMFIFPPLWFKTETRMYASCSSDEQFRLLYIDNCLTCSYRLRFLNIDHFCVYFHVILPFKKVSSSLSLKILVPPNDSQI